MTDIGSDRRPSEWRQLFGLAIGLLDQVRYLTGGFDYALRLQQGQKNLDSPGDLTRWVNAEWPDPNW